MKPFVTGIMGNVNGEILRFFLPAGSGSDFIGVAFLGF
jgi:hypothetical protein